ncbi:hypothetical protein [Knoellia aerolata]|nr:hypothetical protein [Knoellia aerolata]
MPTVRGQITSAYAVGALCAAALLTACGSEGSGGGADVGPSRMPSSSSTPTPSGSPSGSGSSSGSGSGSTAMPPSGRARPTSMTGRVTSIEGGCVVFTSDRDAHQWVLVGETRGLLAGTAYEIDGVAIDTLDPRCPQALPFHVTKAAQVDVIEDLTPVPSAPTQGSEALVSVTGLVTAGVEAGCRVLQTDEGTFVLTGAITVPDGTRVTVSGVKRLDWASTCQQGPVLEVLTMTPTG